MLQSIRANINNKSKTTAIPSLPDPEEEEDLTWFPKDSTLQTIRSLKSFAYDPAHHEMTVDGETLTPEEVRDSYANFDHWLRVEIEHIVAKERRKEDELFDK